MLISMIVMMMMMMMITMGEMNYVRDITILDGKQYQLILMKKNYFVSITTLKTSLQRRRITPLVQQSQGTSE